MTDYPLGTRMPAWTFCMTDQGNKWRGLELRESYSTANTVAEDIAQFTYEALIVHAPLQLVFENAHALEEFLADTGDHHLRSLQNYVRLARTYRNALVLTDSELRELTRCLPQEPGDHWVSDLRDARTADHSRSLRFNLLRHGRRAIGVFCYASVINDPTYTHWMATSLAYVDAMTAIDRREPQDLIAGIPITASFRKDGSEVTTDESFQGEVLIAPQNPRVPIMWVDLFDGGSDISNSNSPWMRDQPATLYILEPPESQHGCCDTLVDAAERKAPPVTRILAVDILAAHQSIR